MKQKRTQDYCKINWTEPLLPTLPLRLLMLTHTKKKPPPVSFLRSQLLEMNRIDCKSNQEDIPQL